MSCRLGVLSSEHGLVIETLIKRSSRRAAALGILSLRRKIFCAGADHQVFIGGLSLGGSVQGEKFS
jgi:hypothetical protein